MKNARCISTRTLFTGTLALTLVLICACAFMTCFCTDNDVCSFSERVIEISDGWTITDASGEKSVLSLPATVALKEDNVYTLSHVLPEAEGIIASPALRFYSNYVDIEISVDGETHYTFPTGKAPFSGATGNTYHFVRLPADYANKTLDIRLRGQLGEDITYLITPPLIGAKATMLKQEVIKSLPLIALCGCMLALAVGLGAIYLAFRKRLKLDRETPYTSLFALLFSMYVFCETSLAQHLVPNGYMLCFTTLMLLALVPIPLMGIFTDEVSIRYKPALKALMIMCAVNFVSQAILNLSGVLSVRVMLPATHISMIVSIIGASLCLILSDKKEKPGALRSFFSAVPMIAGGIADIVLLNLNIPSSNNCLWFAIGVTVFIIEKLYGFVARYLLLYRHALENDLLTDMAYHDTLSGIGNRNAYERRLKELSSSEPPKKLSCIVADINDLKMINDTLGHTAGDIAIAEVGLILMSCMPAGAEYFRTGGDEFVVLIEDCDYDRVRLLASRISAEATERGRKKNIPLSLAVGAGQYEEADRNVTDFIRRIDTLMYECKRAQKGNTR